MIAQAIGKHDRLWEDTHEIIVEENPAEQLWRDMRSTVFPFPSGVADVPEPIRGTAFFPGGLGLWLEENNPTAQFPTQQIIVVGQDFNSVGAYERAREIGTEVDASAAWRGLRELFLASGVSLDRCFFTNLYMGLRDGGRETGKFPGARDKSFVHRCVTFFNRQLVVARPKLILILGLEPFQVLAHALFSMRAPKTLSECAGIYHPVSLVHGSATVVALTHPSVYHANVWRRKYAGLAGMDAEKAMIGAGLTAAFVEGPTPESS